MIIELFLVRISSTMNIDLYEYECNNAYWNFFSVDSSDYMRNGDFIPTRFQAQQDAVNLVCHSKTRSNPENNVGLISMGRYRKGMPLCIFSSYNKPNYIC